MTELWKGQEEWRRTRKTERKKTEEDLKALNEIEEINQETYCNKHSEWVLGWHKHADHEDNNEIENLQAKTHYWICVIKCCSKGIEYGL